MTRTGATGGTEIALWSLETGGRLIAPVHIDGLHEPYGLGAHGVVIASSTNLPEGVVGGLVAISIRDGSARQLVPDSSPMGFVNPTRRVVVSNSGTTLATTICSSAIDFVGDCGVTRILEVESGARVGSLDLDGAEVLALTDETLLVGREDGFEARDLDGEVIWASPSYAGSGMLWYARFLDDHTILANVLLSGDAVGRRLFLFDARSGRSRTLATLREQPSSGDELPNVVLALSTNRFLAIGSGLTSCGLLGFACEPERAAVIDASVLDIETGGQTPGAIHITLRE